MRPTFALGAKRRVRYAFLLAVVGGSACSNGNGGGAEDFQKKVAALKSAAMSDAGPWASAAKAAYEKQIATSGNIDDQTALRELQEESSALTSSICGRIEKDKELSDPGDGGSTEDVVTAAQNAVSDVFSQTTARNPKLLVAFGMTTWGKWPPFMLKEPAPPSDAPVDPSGGGLEAYVKPEFLDGQGGLKIPAVGTAEFTQFSDWYYFDKSRTNALLNQALTTSQPIHDGVRACLDGS